MRSSVGSFFGAFVGVYGWEKRMDLQPKEEDVQRRRIAKAIGVKEKYKVAMDRGLMFG